MDNFKGGEIGEIIDRSHLVTRLDTNLFSSPMTKICLPRIQSLFPRIRMIRHKIVFLKKLFTLLLMCLKGVKAFEFCFQEAARER